MTHRSCYRHHVSLVSCPACMVDLRNHTAEVKTTAPRQTVTRTR